MNPDDLARILDELGRRLGPAGEHVFELAVRQVYVDAVASGVFLLVVVALTVWALPRIERWRTAEDADRYDGRSFVLLAPAILWCLVLLVAAYWALASVRDVLNPEYAALRDILGAIR